MGFLNFVSTLALVSLAFNSDAFVAARPHDHQGSRFKQNRRHGGSSEGGQQQTTIASSVMHTQMSKFHPQGTPTSAGPIASHPPAKSHAHSKAGTATTKTRKAPHASSSSSSKYPPLDYSLVKSYSVGSFFDQFNFYTGSDPTNGFVE
jgi:hypothetical protein